MRRTLFLLLTAPIGISLACSDRSPTSPETATILVASESAGTPPLKTAGRTRHVIVVPPRSNGFVQPGIWGSEKASLTITKDGATLEILASGGCSGSYGEMTQAITNGPFSIAGTFTQLMGAYPGKVVYAAQFLGVVEGNRMSIAIAVPALPQTFGPFPLMEGVNNVWSRCLYP
jgi:hypothetical protein